MKVNYLVGDTRDMIAGIPDGSVDLIATSPPFLALRSYLPAGHESKGDEIGAERNPAEFIDMLLGLTAEWGRVLAPHGSIAIELGDTYSNCAPSGNAYKGQSGYGIGGHGYEVGDGRPRGSRLGTGWPRAKSLALIPQLYAVALAYGINPLTGQPSPAGRWLVRNVIVWHRPNPAVGALGDKVRPSTSYIVVATRSAKRWFDLTAVRTPGTSFDRAANGSNGAKGRDRSDVGKWDDHLEHHPAGAPPLDCWLDEHDSSHDTWTLTTQPSSLAHYAMWPARLAERLILSMCPREVCRVCGEPRRRVERRVDRQSDMQAEVARHIRDRRETLGLSRREVNSWFGLVAGIANWERTDGAASAVFPRPHEWLILRDRLGLSSKYDSLILGDRVWTQSLAEYTPNTSHGLGWADSHRNQRANENLPTLKSATRHSRDAGWTDCGHDNYRPGHTLDPFAGTGTTLAVADLHGRDATGIDFDQRNHDIYPARFAEVKRALFNTPIADPAQMELAL